MGYDEILNSPEFIRLRGCTQSPIHHPEGDVWEHVMCVLDQAKYPIAWLCHDLGKPDTWDDSKGRITNYGHDKVGARIARSMLERLGYSDIEAIVSCTEQHMKFFQADKMKRSTLEKFINQPNFDMMLDVHRLDCLSSKGDMGTYNFIIGKL